MRAIHRFGKTVLTLMSVIAVLLSGRELLFAAGRRPPRAVYVKQYEVRVIKVVDGDTVDVAFLGETPPECDGSCQRIRLIGVDTPEYYKKVRQPYADEAKAYTGSCLGTDMLLQLDWDTSYKDRYGRLLAYLYAEDGSMLNYELVRNGYGRYYGKFKFNRQNMASFSQAEEYAREHRLGLWGLEAEGQLPR